MNQEYWHAREVSRIYEELSDAQRKIELLQVQISCLEAEVTGLLVLSQEYLRQLQLARASVWV
jgi:hypothetical protein